MIMGSEVVQKQNWNAWNPKADILNILVQPYLKKKKEQS